MSSELTLETLDKAIAEIELYGEGHKVIGFKINPADLREIRAGTMFYCGIVNDALIKIPPYRGMPLYSDETQPRGYIKYIRRNCPECWQALLEEVK